MAPFRQNRYRAHEATRSIVFAWLENTWQAGEVVELMRPRYPPPELTAQVWAFAERLLVERPGVIAKLMLAELASGQRIRRHSDEAPALVLAHRCHLPILSNEQVVFNVDHEPRALQPGVCYELDNTRPHAVRNDGPSPRVHLICDVLPEAACRRVA